MEFWEEPITCDTGLVRHYQLIDNSIINRSVYTKLVPAPIKTKIKLDALTVTAHRKYRVPKR